MTMAIFVYLYYLEVCLSLYCVSFAYVRGGRKELLMLGYREVRLRIYDSSISVSFIYVQFAVLMG